MYVYYWVDDTEHVVVFLIDWFDNPLEEYFSKMYGSECCWIVPGTVED